MRQHPDPDGFHDQGLNRYDEDDEFGRPLYQGSGLTVRELTAEELQGFLDAHQGQPAQLLGSGWAGLDPPASLGVPWTPLAATQPMAPAGPPAGSLGRPGRSALVEYRRRRALELAGWTRGLAWRAPLVAAVGAVAQVLAVQGGLPRAGLADEHAGHQPGGGRQGRPPGQAAGPRGQLERAPPPILDQGGAPGATMAAGDWHGGRRRDPSRRGPGHPLGMP